MENDFILELFWEELFLDKKAYERLSGYMLPMSFKQGNILYYVKNSELNLEVFYNQAMPHKKSKQEIRKKLFSGK